MKRGATLGLAVIISAPWQGVSAQPGMGTVKVTSSPSGATVFVGATPVGVTPLNQGNVPEGAYELLVRLPGYTDSVASMGVIAGKTSALDVTLVPVGAAPAPGWAPSGAVAGQPAARVANPPPSFKPRGAGRFARSGNKDAALSSMFDDVRSLIKPLYEVRGALFHLRCELLRLSAEEEDAGALAPWSHLGLADAGWLATQVHFATVHDGKKAATTRRIRAGRVFGGTGKRSKPVKRNLKWLASRRVLDANHAFDFESMIQRLQEDPNSPRRIVSHFNGLRAALKRLTKAMARLPQMPSRIEKAAGKFAAQAKKAGGGSGQAFALVALDGLTGAVAAGALVEDVRDLSQVTAGIVADSQSLGRILKQAGEKIPSLRPPAMWDGIQAALPGPQFPGQILGLAQAVQTVASRR